MSNNDDEKQLEIRPLTVDDRNWVAQRLDEHWGSTRIASRGEVYLAHTLPGFAALEGEEVVGLLTYNVRDEDIEVVTINSFQRGEGVGTALLEALRNAAIKSEKDYRRIWLIITNDNLPALKFFQKRDFELVMIHRNAMDSARKLKPEIPLYGHEDIPVRDEIELEIPADNLKVMK